MDYKLCSRILQHRHCTEDVRQLVVNYIQEVANTKSYIRILEEKEQLIKILEAENRFLKEQA